MFKILYLPTGFIARMIISDREDNAFHSVFSMLDEKNTAIIILYNRDEKAKINNFTIISVDSGIGFYDIEYELKHLKNKCYVDIFYRDVTWPLNNISLVKKFSANLLRVKEACIGIVIPLEERSFKNPSANSTITSSGKFDSESTEEIDAEDSSIDWDYDPILTKNKLLELELITHPNFIKISTCHRINHAFLGTELKDCNYNRIIFNLDHWQFVSPILYSTVKERIESCNKDNIIESLNVLKNFGVFPQPKLYTSTILFDIAFYKNNFDIDKKCETILTSSIKNIIRRYENNKFTEIRILINEIKKIIQSTRDIFLSLKEFEEYKCALKILEEEGIIIFTYLVEKLKHTILLEIDRCIKFYEAYLHNQSFMQKQAMLFKEIFELEKPNDSDSLLERIEKSELIHSGNRFTLYLNDVELMYSALQLTQLLCSQYRVQFRYTYFLEAKKYFLYALPNLFTQLQYSQKKMAKDLYNIIDNLFNMCNDKKMLCNKMDIFATFIHQHKNQDYEYIFKKIIAHYVINYLKEQCISQKILHKIGKELIRLPQIEFRKIFSKIRFHLNSLTDCAVQKNFSRLCSFIRMESIQMVNFLPMINKDDSFNRENIKKNFSNLYTAFFSKISLSSHKDRNNLKSQSVNGIGSPRIL